MDTLVAPTQPRSTADTFATALGIAISLAIVALDVRWYQHAGGLWRDEVSSVNTVSQPSLVQFWRNNEDSFPNLWGSFLYGWISFGPGDSDRSLRTFGLLIGLGLIVALWAGRRCGLRVPWVALLVLGLNPGVIAYGSEVRAYGFGIITELMMLGSLVWFAREPSWPRTLAAALAAVVAVQSAYPNSVILAAAGIAWGIVFLIQRRWRAFGRLAGICVLAVLSDLPYLATFHRHSEWADIFRQEVGVRTVWDQVVDVLSLNGLPMFVLWPAMLTLAILAGLWLISRQQNTSVPKDQIAWCLLALVLGHAAHFAYIRFLSVGGTLWYAFPLLALTAFCLDLVLGGFVAEFPKGKQASIAVCQLLSLVMLNHDWHKVNQRMTNIDLAAAYLEEHAAPSDLIVVYPWFCESVFDRYYHGSSRWIGLPDLDDKRSQNPRLFRSKMTKVDAIRKEIDLVRATLTAGQRVWFLGGLRMVPPGQVPLTLPNAPPPDRPGLWYHAVYSDSWSAQMAYALQSHQTKLSAAEFMSVPVQIQMYEDLPLIVAQGWEEPAKD